MGYFLPMCRFCFFSSQKTATEMENTCLHFEANARLRVTWLVQCPNVQLVQLRRKWSYPVLPPNPVPCHFIGTRRLSLCAFHIPWKGKKRGIPTNPGSTTACELSTERKNDLLCELCCRLRKPPKLFPNVYVQDSIKCR